MPRGIIVIAPAWHSCGSYEVFKNQVATFKSLGYATYFLAVSRKTKAWKHPGGYWDDYLKLTPDIGADVRGETHQAGSLFKPGVLLDVILPALGKSVVTWRALPATLAPIPHSLHQFVAGHDRIDIVCNHYFNLPLAERIKTLKPGARLILETHDIQSRQFLDQKLVHPVTRRAQDYDKMLAEEIAYCQRADILVHLNEDEAAEFARLLPEKRHELIFPMMRPTDEAGDTPTETVEPFDFLIVMSGNHANVASLKWFLEEVWSPEFDQKFSLKIVGVIDQAFKTRHRLLFDGYKHRFTGRVPSLAPYYRAASAVFVPMVQGHGISIKTIEAMSYGKPIIGTRGAFRGFGKSLEAAIAPDIGETIAQFRNKTSFCARRVYPINYISNMRLCEQGFAPEIHHSKYELLLNDQKNSVTRSNEKLLELVKSNSSTFAAHDTGGNESD